MAKADRSESSHTVQLELGDTVVEAHDCGEFHAETSYEPPVLSDFRDVTDRYGKTLYPAKPGYSTLVVLDYVIQSHLHTLNQEVYDYYPGCFIPRAHFSGAEASLVVLSHASYVDRFKLETDLPPWAGVCIRNGIVIYDGAYLDAVWAGNGSYGGYVFTPDYFYRELGHELGHVDDLYGVFLGDEGMADHFSETSSSVLEGMRELLVGVAQPDGEFNQVLADYIARRPTLTSHDLRNWLDFVQVDGGPAGVNLAYQYSARWMRELAPSINGWWKKRFKERIHTPYGGVYMLWVLARNRYLEGYRESYYDTLCEVFGELGVNEDHLRKIEKDWQKRLLEKKGKS